MKPLEEHRGGLGRQGLPDLDGCDWDDLLARTDDVLARLCAVPKVEVAEAGR